MAERPDLPAGLRAVLDGPLAWYDLEHHDEVGSTNAVAAERIATGAPAGVVVVADRQTAGRGRLDRTWVDVPDGASLLASMTVPLPERDATLVPLVAGVAAADAAKRAGAHLRIKWPNDLVDAEDRKAGGILVERHEGPAGPQLVVGIGVNLDWRGVPREGEATAWTSLAEVSGLDVDRWAYLADLLRGLDAWIRDLLRGSHRAVEACTAKCSTLDRDVRVTTPDGRVLEGRATQLAPDGALVVDVPGQGLLAVSAGDVVHARPA